MENFEEVCLYMFVSPENKHTAEIFDIEEGDEDEEDNLMPTRATDKPRFQKPTKETHVKAPVEEYRGIMPVPPPIPGFIPLKPFSTTLTLQIFNHTNHPDNPIFIRNVLRNSRHKFTMPFNYYIFKASSTILTFKTAEDYAVFIKRVPSSVFGSQARFIPIQRTHYMPQPRQTKSVVIRGVSTDIDLYDFKAAILEENPYLKIKNMIRIISGRGPTSFVRVFSENERTIRVLLLGGLQVLGRKYEVDPYMQTTKHTTPCYTCQNLVVQPFLWHFIQLPERPSINQLHQTTGSYSFCPVHHSGAYYWSGDVNEMDGQPVDYYTE